MHLQTNPELELAYEYVCHTNKHVFLTGKAGTGKTTFLHRIKSEQVKRMAVVAPTGVAAINAGGMTIHSLFQLPFGPFLPGNTRDAARQRKFTREKIRLIKSLDLLVIDEISMVRADLLDGIDDVLRRYKNLYEPFGGVQLLMIGDLHQLPPVVKEEEWDLLRPFYDTPYFFGSQALRKRPPVVVELKHIYRQSDTAFIQLLNKVRNNALDNEVLSMLNSRFDPDFQPKEEDAYITLTTHNTSAQEINADKLEGIAHPKHVFKAEVDGDFPAFAYPADEVLELKADAQVMFVKNDISPDKRYYNGKIGKVTRIKEATVYVQCPDEEVEIAVGTVEWSNMKYTLNEQTKEVQEEVLGVFTQYPLKLAWAITIHKSQGLTFERVLLDAQAAFAHGQVYVALSRCKSFEGIVLRSRIIPSSVKTDSTVQHYAEAAAKNAPDGNHLKQSKAAFQQLLILELFEFAALKTRIERLNRVLLENESSLLPGAVPIFNALKGELQGSLFPVAEKFIAQLKWLFLQSELPEQNGELQERIQKAGAWFLDKLTEVVTPAVKRIPVITDNKQVRKTVLETLDNLHREVFMLCACFAAASSGFSAQAYLRIKANADLDYQTTQQTKPAVDPSHPVPAEVVHPNLYRRLVKWREKIARKKQLDPYEVLPAQSLLQIVQDLPSNTLELKNIKGIGKERIKKFGMSILTLIHTYCSENKIPLASNVLALPSNPLKEDTKAVTLALYRSGMTIEEIAAERSLVLSTVEGHLAHFISLGELDIFEFMDKTDVEKIDHFLSANDLLGMAEVKAHFEDAYSYGQIKMVMKYREKT